MKAYIPDLEPIGPACALDAGLLQRQLRQRFFCCCLLREMQQQQALERVQRAFCLMCSGTTPFLFTYHHINNHHTNTNNQVRTASCAGTACVNSFGDEQLAVDVLADNLLFEALRYSVRGRRRRLAGGVVVGGSDV
jgi:hypothetical protein